MSNFAQYDPYPLLDSGERAIFDGGAVRDTTKGKGRFDLISPFALQRLAWIYQKALGKYPIRNWETGISYTRCIDSALRHILQWIMGKRDEDHLAQAAWNLFTLMHFEEVGLTDFDDMPHYMNVTEEDV